MPLQRFNSTVRPDVVNFVGNDPGLLKTAETCPGLVVALACQHAPTADALDLAQKMAIAKNIPAALALVGLPNWIIGLDASAFGKDLGDLPGGLRIDSALKSTIPAKREDHRAFLIAIQAMARYGDAPATVWLAHAMKEAQLFVTEEHAALIGFYAIASRYTDSEAVKLMLAPWSDSMDLAKAARHAQSWVNWMTLTARLGGHDIKETWRAGGTFKDREFRPIVNAAHCAAVARDLDNCAYQLAPVLESNDVRLFAIYVDGQTKALCQIQLRNDGMIQCTQLKGYKNKRCDDETIDAVHVFLGEAKRVGAGGPTGERIADAPPRVIDQTWTKLAAPYLALKGGNKFIPISGTAAALTKLSERAAKLDKVSHVDFLRRMLRDRV